MLAHLPCVLENQDGLRKVPAGWVSLCLSPGACKRGSNGASYHIGLSPNKPPVWVMGPTGRHTAQRTAWLLKAIRRASLSPSRVSHSCSELRSFGKDNTLLEIHLFPPEAFSDLGMMRSHVVGCSATICDLGESHSKWHLEVQHQILEKIKEFTHGQRMES